MEQEIAETAAQVVAKQPGSALPVDRVPAQIREEAKRSAEIIRSSAQECASRIVEASQAVMVRAQADLALAESHAEEVRARADLIAKSLEAHGEIDAQVAEAMNNTIQMILA